MFKNRKKIIATMIFLMFFLLISYLNYQVSQERQVLIGNRLYSAWSIELVEEHSLGELIDWLPRNSRMFLEHSEDGNIRTIYQKDNWKPPMISGIFFNGGSASPLAVVGEYHANQNERYLEIGGISYEIIGVMGAGFPSTLDRLVLLNVRPESLPILNVVLDSRRADDFANLMNEFQFQQRLTENTPEELLGTFVLTRVVRQNMVILITLLSILLGYVFTQATKKENSVYYLMGWSHVKIFLKNAIELLSLTLKMFSLVFFLDFIIGQEVFVANILLFVRLLLLILVSYSVFYLVMTMVLNGGNSND